MEQDLRFGQELEFSHDGRPFLSYVSHTWLLDSDGEKVRPLATETIVTLAHEVPTILALKDAGGDPSRAARLLAEAPDDFEVYSGDEPLSLAFAAYGAVGVVGVSSHWTAVQQRDMWDAFAKGDVAMAREINARLLPSYQFMNSDTCVFSQAVKVAMGVLGVSVGECRLPLGPPPAGTDVLAREVLQKLGYPT